MVADRTSPHTKMPGDSGAQRRTRRLCVIAFLLLTQLAAGCVGATLANTEIPDNDDTRAIHAKVLAYKEAMTARDTDAIIPLRGIQCQLNCERAFCRPEPVDQRARRCVAKVCVRDVVLQLACHLRAFRR